MPLVKGHDIVTTGAVGATGAALTFIEQVLVAVCTGVPVSVTWSVKLANPAAVAVPEIRPAELSVKPAGNVPALIE